MSDAHKAIDGSVKCSTGTTVLCYAVAVLNIIFVLALSLLVLNIGYAKTSLLLWMLAMCGFGAYVIYTSYWLVALPDVDRVRSASRRHLVAAMISFLMGVLVILQGLLEGRSHDGLDFGMGVFFAAVGYGMLSVYLLFAAFLFRAALQMGIGEEQR